MGSPDENANWVFDYGLIDDVLPVPGVDLHALDPPAPLGSSSSHSLTNTVSFSIQFDDSLDNSDGLKENGSQKWLRPGSGNTPGPGLKVCREKIWRDRLNDRIMELSALLDPERSPKLDKSAMPVDAVGMVTQSCDEAQKLKTSNENLWHKINELKAEKNELSNEKQRLGGEGKHGEASNRLECSSAPSAAPSDIPSSIFCTSFEQKAGALCWLPWNSYVAVHATISC